MDIDHYWVSAGRREVGLWKKEKKKNCQQGEGKASGVNFPITEKAWDPGNEAKKKQLSQWRY